MLEVANFEHARFGVLSQCYSFRHFTATDPNFAFSIYPRGNTYLQNENPPVLSTLGVQLPLPDQNDLVYFELPIATAFPD